MHSAPPAQHPSSQPSEEAGPVHGTKKVSALEDLRIPPVIGLGQGTVVRLLDSDGPGEGKPRRGVNLSLNYEFVERGQASQFQIKKRLRRLVVTMLVRTIAKDHPTSRWKREDQRNQRWIGRHLDFHPYPGRGEDDAD